MATRQNPIQKPSVPTAGADGKPKPTLRKTPLKKATKPKAEAAEAKADSAVAPVKPKLATPAVKADPAGAGAVTVAGGTRSAAAASTTAAKPPPAAVVDVASERLLSRAEADMSRLLESLNTQMNTAMAAFTEVIAAQRGPHETVTRTRPLDRATAMFQRLITELMDERLAEMLPTVVSLRSEMHQRAEAAGAEAEDDFASRATAMLDQVLASADVHAYEPRAGEAFDPLIHMAVGEAHREDLPNDVVAQSIQPGYRTSRGKVIAPARVMVNRR